MPGSEIRLDHVRVLRYRRVVALGENFAAREHRDMVRKRRHHRQVVLDHEHRAVRRDLADQRSDALDVRMGHAGGRFVEQHHLRVEGERGGDLERTLAPVGQLHRGRRGKAAEPDRFNELLGAPVQRVERARGAPELERTATLALQRDAHVLQHREVGKHRRDLERAHQPLARDLRRPRAGYRLSVEQDLARGRGQEVGKQVKAGGLARAVGTDQGVDRAAAHVQVDTLDRDKALELLGESARLQNDIVGHAPPGGSAARRVHWSCRGIIRKRLDVGNGGRGTSRRDHLLHWGARFATNASMPSPASASSTLQAMTPPA
jgi:hypothetical protein